MGFESQYDEALSLDSGAARILSAFQDRATVVTPVDFLDAVLNGTWRIELDTWDGCDNAPAECDPHGILTVTGNDLYTLLNYTDKDAKIAYLTAAEGELISWIYPLHGSAVTEDGRIKITTLHDKGLAIEAEAEVYTADAVDALLSNPGGGTTEVIQTVNDEFFAIPEVDQWRTAGGIDPVTGLHRLVFLAFNQYGILIDRDDNNTETIWFKSRGKIADLRDILDLYPKPETEKMPLLAQNGISAWWTEQLENLVNGPVGLTGDGDIEVKTIGKACKVTVRNDDGEVYNYTHDLTANTVIWLGWHIVPTLAQLAEVGKLFKAIGPQKMGQANIYDLGDGTFAMGSLLRFAGAVFSVAGRMGVHDALFDDDAVNLRTLKAALSGVLTDEEWNAAYDHILDLLANKSDRGHGHAISEVNGLGAELDGRVQKATLLLGKPYYVLGRDSNGNAVMIDNKGAALNGQYLPDAIEGVLYNQTLARGLFVYPDNPYQIDLVKLSDKAWVRNGLTWDWVTGLNLTGTPPDSENPHIAVKLKWKFSETDEWKEQEFAIFLNIEPSGTVITAPAAPSGLTATPSGTTIIDLVWVDNSSNETGFRIYRGTDSGDLSQIATVAAGTTAYQSAGLQPATPYFYRVEAYNTAGAASSNEANAVTGSVTNPTLIDRPVSGSSRIRQFGTVVVPPVVVTPATGRPNIKFGFQPARYVESREVIWEHQTTKQRRAFLTIDQNNNPSQEIPDSNWKVVEVTDTEINIKRTSAAGGNYIDVWFRTPLLQVSQLRYTFEIVGRLLDVAAAEGVYLSFGIKQDIGNGGIPERIGFGHDQSAPWRFTLAQCEKSQRFGDEVGGSTRTEYPADLAPCLLHLAVQNNLATFYTAFCGYLRNHPNKAWVSSIHPIYSNTGEAHLGINEERYMPASIMAMQTFRTWLLGKSSATRSLFSAFIADHANESNTDARAFLRGYASQDAQKVWQWFLQHEYFIGYSGDITNGPYARLSAIVRGAGFRFKRDDGSFLDFSAARGNMYALAPIFTNCFDILKQNPAGSRVGYPEAAALKATGKIVGLEWTPGAIGPGEDFGDEASAIGTITTACKTAWDAGVDEQILSFVVNNNYYNSVAIPIINNLKEAGYWTLPKQTFTPSTVFDVDLTEQLKVGGWYHNDSDGAPEFNEPIHRMATAVSGESGGVTRANIQKYGFRILSVNNPAL